MPDLRAFWGKAGKSNTPHPLLCHALDTAAVAELLYPLMLGPRCREELEAAFKGLGDPVAWVAVLCGLHDLGKCSPAFQGLRADLALDLLGDHAAEDIRRLSRFKDVGRTDTPHGLLTAVHMDRLLKRWGASWEAAHAIAWVLGGHHGTIPYDDEVREARAAVGHHGGQKWADWCDALVDELCRLRGLPNPASLPWNEVRLGLVGSIGLAGLTSVSDWIASARCEDKYAGAGVDLESYAAETKKVAQDAVDRREWSPWKPPADTRFQTLFPDVEPRPVQVAVEKVTSGKSRPGLLIVEAPTGEGKTKVALQAAATFVRQLGLAGFYFGLPTRATANQIFTESAEFLAGQPDPLRVRLLHGAADEYLVGQEPKAEEERRKKDLQPCNVDSDGEGDGDAAAREWFTLKRALLASVGVGTWDQALMAAIRAPHVFVRMAALSNKVVILDEVHAYDRYMSTLLDRLLWWLGRFEVPVILLSATLPEHRRSKLVQCWRAGALRLRPEQVSTPLTAPGYPRVTWADREGDEVTLVEELVEVGVSELNANRVVRLIRLGDDDVVSWVLEQIDAGGCAAIIHNLKSRVHETYEKLEKAVEQLPEDERPELIWITGEMETADRQKVEKRLREAFGKNGTRPKRAVVVGTQVLEQSLDLDFDVMVSDLAPVDSMVQRMGRLHRHRKREETPVLAITGVGEKAAGPTFPPYTLSVYLRSTLTRTWALLRERSEIRSPDEVAELVDAVYDPKDLIVCPEGWEEAWQDNEDRRNLALEGMEYKARIVYLPQPSDDQSLRRLTERSKGARHTRSRSGKR
ncbi:CRISPR-associated helicase/endonuclease Cas3 [Streptoalloteichus hindustanus]|uniref:CRISPR-associated helicase, Cas3 family n=1 Tax=Streptoalloteichus hindustanus TaxID=2017 RepID=A0A1M5LD15_STRHI|nr:CRISPR-associated helicase/endonuclease Cas3 [Streptoalloteichus hindustanus]SHG62951.1 CRISPR-associated helicase, Cas3 family [Streptoalloteichus hindustanus]